MGIKLSFRCMSCGTDLIVRKAFFFKKFDAIVRIGEDFNRSSFNCPVCEEIMVFYGEIPEL